METRETMFRENEKVQKEIFNVTVATKNVIDIYIYISNGRLGAQPYFDGAQRIKNDRYRKRQETSCHREPEEGQNTANEEKSYI